MKASDHFHFVAGNQVAQAQPSLVTCYLPVIGDRAFLLYQYLLTFYDGGQERHAFTEILNHLQFGMGPLQTSLTVLEGIGLVKHYQEGQEHWLLLRPALDSRRFLEQSVLVSLLSQKIGEPAVNRLRQQLPVQAKEVTQHFSQVFGDQGQVLAPEAPDTAVESFAFDYFQQQMDKDGLRLGNAQQDTIALYRIAEQEKLTWHQLYVIAKETASRKVIQPQRILAQLKKAPNDSRVDELTAKEAVIVREAQADKAPIFLAKIKKARRGQVLKDERQVLEDLASQGFLDEVINVMVLYTFNKTQSANLNKRYLTKLANDLAYQKVTTAKEAVLKLRAIRERKKAKKTTDTTSNNVPEWSNPQYENHTTKEELAQLQALRERSRQRLEKLGKDKD